MNETPASDQEIEDAIREFHEERASEGVTAAQSLASVSVYEGIAKVVYESSLSRTDAEAWLSENSLENLAAFAATPLAQATPESTRMRMSTVRVEASLADGTPLGALENAGIRALNGLEK
ncbi:hypothetical protein [Leucobacter sp. NPDC077196]|uniref:hypothetical protein n=1 Tax=Leucobacter sp. NPDC077196 TaxID=3154959 RepID=UPI0034417926